VFLYAIAPSCWLTVCLSLQVQLLYVRIEPHVFSRGWQLHAACSLGRRYSCMYVLDGAMIAIAPHIKHFSETYRIVTRRLLLLSKCTFVQCHYLGIRRRPEHKVSGALTSSPQPRAIKQKRGGRKCAMGSRNARTSFK
jgi:hypothetical protein